MLLRPSTLLLLPISALSVVASLGSNVEFNAVSDDIKKHDFADGYWFEEDADKRGYEMAKAVVPKVKTNKYKNGEGDHHSVEHQGRHGAQSSQKCKTITYKHHTYANCAETNSVSTAVREKWIASSPGSDVPKGSYGKPGQSEGFQNPCADGHEKGNGCQRFLSDHPNIQLVSPAKKRAVKFTV